MATSPREGISGTILFESAVNGEGTEDTIQRFAADVEHVLHNLRGSELDPDIPAHIIGRENSLTYSKTW